MKTMPFEIITPEKVLFHDEVEFIVAPGSCGELGILPGHMRLMTDLIPGNVQVVKGQERKRFVISEGFIAIEPAAVKIFAPVARPA